MIWWMLGAFVAGMVMLGMAIDAWIDHKYNPEKQHEH